MLGHGLCSLLTYDRKAKLYYADAELFQLRQRKEAATSLLDRLRNPFIRLNWAIFQLGGCRSPTR